MHQGGSTRQCCFSEGVWCSTGWCGPASRQPGSSPTHVAAAPSPTSSLTGIIDLSQVPHLPVLVPPTPGTPATAMDRLAYLPTAPQHFSSRLSSSPLSPGDAPTLVLGVLGQMPCPLCSIPEDESGWWGAGLPVPGAEPQAFGFPGGPTHLTKPTTTSSTERERERERDREREREREKSILTSTTTVEHAPIWRPGRTAEPPARAPGAGSSQPHQGSDSTACLPQVQSRAVAAVAAAAAGVGAAAAAAPPPTPMPTSTRPSHRGPRTPSSRGPVCCTTRA